MGFTLHLTYLFHRAWNQIPFIDYFAIPFDHRFAYLVVHDTCVFGLLLNLSTMVNIPCYESLYIYENKKNMKMNCNKALEFSLKWCPIGSHFHLLFGALSSPSCVQSLSIRDQNLKTQHELPSKNIFSSPWVACL